MDNIYILMIAALAILAIVDLVVGVSNDAVNFLNAAIGSRVINIKTILIIASLGVFVGAITSSGMMEVARKGIFNPSMFNFQNIMYIFMAVMITDILLLDVFNTLGMPTSTTVSIVFELLGAAVAMAFIKISANPNETSEAIWNYINYEKALQIIFGILLSVVFAFTIGAIVQFFSRLLYSFEIEKQKKHISILFGGFALTTISYFIFFKGFKGTSFYKVYHIKEYLEQNLIQIFAIGFLFWTLFSLVISKFTKFNILHIIIGIGTFSLALAFSGNDLVNFVGVPIAAWNSYEAWHSSGIAATDFSMEILSKKVPSNNLLLLFAGAIMVITIWFSKKAKEVIKTGIDLSRQGEGHEKFQPTAASRISVRTAMVLNKVFHFITPKSTLNWVNSRFERSIVSLPKNKAYKMPAFDTIRASVNLVVAGILISYGTSKGLPLSTTYVTFMVAMGTSLADRAWGRESAVYRVAGVLNVIGGWFATAIIAFAASGVALYLINLGGIVSVAILLITVTLLISRNYIKYAKKEKDKKAQRQLDRTELITINGVIDESSSHISEVIRRVNKLYTNVAKDLASHDLDKLKKTNKHVDKLNDEVDQLKDEVFYFIKSLDETSAEASRFYIVVIGYLQDISQSISYISKSSYKHVNNNHKNLKKSQINELKEIDSKLEKMLQKIEIAFTNKKFDNFNSILEDKQLLLEDVRVSIEKQVHRIRQEKTETSPKNTTLFFGILLETKDLLKAIISLLELYQEFDFNIKRAEEKDNLLN
ncbi:MAG: inorganic phosphate transporter [Flavobacteriaceae bacterium]|nr:inorganic phosphate transporter [Flavobacteriaceae bacterium]